MFISVPLYVCNIHVRVGSINSKKHENRDINLRQIWIFPGSYDYPVINQIDVKQVFFLHYACIIRIPAKN